MLIPSPPAQSAVSLRFNGATGKYPPPRLDLNHFKATEEDLCTYLFIRLMTLTSLGHGTDEQSLPNPRNFTGEDAEIPQSTLLHFGKGRQCLCTIDIIGRTTTRGPSQAHYSTLDLCHRCARGTYQPRVKLPVAGHLNDNGVYYGNITEPSPHLELRQFKQIALFLCEKS
jgi:hypothetical protein